MTKTPRTDAACERGYQVQADFARILELETISLAAINQELVEGLIQLDELNGFDYDTMPEGHRKIAQSMTRDFVGRLIAKASAKEVPK